MKHALKAAAAAISLAALCQASRAASAEDTMSTVTLLMFYGSIAFAVVAFASVYYLRPPDRRQAPLSGVFTAGEAVYSVAPDTLVAECVRRMTARNIGALIVSDGAAIRGIFTERDALTRVLAEGLDPAQVRVEQVMTREPVTVAPDTTVDAAMALVTQRRFRHLPVVENGRLLAVVSSGDLTRWMVGERGGAVRELAGLAAQE